MEWAIESWLGAANAGGQQSSQRNIIDINHTSGTGNIRFVFEDMGSGGNIDYGQWAGNEIKINSNIPWTLNTWEVGTKVDLKSLLVHEVGHLFLGGGHSSDQSSALRVFNNFEVKRSIGLCTEQAAHNLYDPPKYVTLKNSFGGNGMMVVDGSPVSIASSGKQYAWRTSSFPHSVAAVTEQNISGTTYYFDQWIENSSPFSQNSSISINLPSSSSIVYEADYNPIVKVNFQNNLSTIGNHGVIKVNGTSYSVTTPYFNVEQGQSIQVEAPYQQYNGIWYTFSHWSNTSTSNPLTYFPTSNTTLKAYYSASIEPVTYTSYSGPTGDPITVSWIPNPNSNVVYKVYRKIKYPSGSWDGPFQIATLNNTISSYTDPNCTFTSGYTNELILYDVRPYYSAENLTAPANYVTVFGEAGMVPKRASIGENSSLPTNNLLGNYPNPFNPETEITFALKADAVVVLHVYNLNGQVVLGMDAQQLNAGRYNMHWNGKNKDGGQLSTGIYIAKLIIQPLNENKSEVISHRMSLIR